MNDFRTEGFQGDRTPGAPAKSVSDQAAKAGRQIQDAAANLAAASSEAIKGQATEFVAAAKDVASQAGETLQKTVDERKGAGADYVASLADTIRRAAGEFNDDVPLAATYIRKAADQVETVADTLREGNVSDLIRGAQSFARSQPTAFLGLAVLTGFGAIRFLKSASGRSEVSSSGADESRNSDESRSSGMNG